MKKKSSISTKKLTLNTETIRAMQNDPADAARAAMPTQPPLCAGPTMKCGR